MYLWLLLFCYNRKLEDELQGAAWLVPAIHWVTHNRHTKAAMQFIALKLVAVANTESFYKRDQWLPFSQRVIIILLKTVCCKCIQI